MFRVRYAMLALLLIAGLALVACDGGSSPTVAEPTQPPADTGGEVVVPAATQPPASSAGKVTIRWYVGIGAGSDESTFADQEKVVADFNASQDRINLVLEIVDNASAKDILNTQIAAGNAPDIVGPVGIFGRAAFPGAWLDLDPLIEESGYDLSDFDPEMVRFYEVGGQQLGLPFAIFPSFIFVNLDLFDEAGLPYPPQEYGDPYIDENGVEKEWNIDTLREVAMKLTVDANGNDANDPDFDPDNIVQFGYGTQWTDLRGRAAMFGSGNLVDDAENATVPPHWVEAWQWYQDAMWVDYFHPNGPYGGSDVLGGGNWFESGNMAMAHVHLWYATCCIGGLEAAWDTAVVPSYRGTTVAKMHADTFGIMKSTRHPQEAFEVLTYLIGPAVSELTQIYGGMPARISLQDGYFDTLDAGRFAGENINWDVVVASMGYPDNPNHEEGLPSYLEAVDRYNQFNQLLDNDPTLDVAAEVERLIRDLQAIYDAAR